MELEFAGHQWRLYPQGGLYWPEQQALLVADLHLGREASLRRASLAVPPGSTAATLQHLDELICASGARRVLILGDLFHAACSLAADVVADFQCLMQRYPKHEWLLVRGNHDRRLRKLPRDWPLKIVEPPFELDGVLLYHEPPQANDRFAIAAHVHPAVRLRLAGAEGHRAACLWRRGSVLILPALGDFTGTGTIHPRADDEIWMLVDGEVVRPPSTLARYIFEVR